MDSFNNTMSFYNAKQESCSRWVEVFFFFTGLCQVISMYHRNYSM